MKWTFRSKLMTAFLLFGLVPTLIMTFVTTQATNQLTDAAARLVYRGSLFASKALSRSPLEEAEGRHRPDPGQGQRRADRIDTFDAFLKEYKVLSRLALVAPDGVVVATRSRPDAQNPFAVGQKIAGPYAELLKNRAGEGKPISHRGRRERPGGRGHQPHLPAGEGGGQARGVLRHLDRPASRTPTGRST